MQTSRGANLSGADFTNANLSWVVFYPRVKLNNANLSGANLSGVSLIKIPNRHTILKGVYGDPPCRNHDKCKNLPKTKN